MFVDKPGTADDLKDQLRAPLNPRPAFAQLSGQLDVDNWACRITRVLHASLNLYGLNTWFRRRLHKGALNVRRICRGRFSSD